MTKISCTPASTRLSNVQSSSVALQTGRRHYQDAQHWVAGAEKRERTHSWFAEGEGAEAGVEAVGENDGLEDVVLAGEVLVGGGLWRHLGLQAVMSADVFSDRRP